MPCELVLTPAGRVRLQQGDDHGGATPDTWLVRVADAFSSSLSGGLFALAATRPDAQPPPSFTFWRDFACRYMACLCRTPESAGDRLDPIEVPAEPELAAMVLCACGCRTGGGNTRAPVWS